MCGFLAEVSTSLTNIHNFTELLNLSLNRGPDHQDIWSDGENCRFGFNRLAILDITENGRQPIISPSGRFVLMLNGEIYNYKSLQLYYDISDKLLRSASDTEVISQLLEHLPLCDLLHQLDGMFAISVFDQQEQTLTLARDFAGIKPLYYGITENTLVFASQFNQVFLHSAFRSNLKLRSEIVKEYMGLGYMQAPNTVFENIYQLQPGEYLVYDVFSNNLKYKNNFFKWKEKPLLEETSSILSKRFNEIFGKVVKSQLQSDVPLASFLSGGIDSPLVSAHAHTFEKEIIAFTLHVGDPSFNESEIASQIACHVGMNQELIQLTETDLLQSVEDHFKGIPEPHGDFSSIPTWAICKHASNYATVMLSGDGGDELFWGYPRFLKAYKNLHWFNYPKWIRKVIMPLKRLFDSSVSEGPQLFNTFGDWTLHKQLKLFDLDKLLPNTDYSVELKNIYFFEGRNSEDALLFLKRNEFYAHMQRVLRKVDLMSMANSVEVRVPFLSKEIIEFSNTIKPQLGINHNTPKIILKKALEHHIPTSIIDYQKRGFSIPIEKWMKGPLKYDIEQTLLMRPIFGADFINVSFLTSLVNDFFADKPINAWGIWHIYAWQKWAIENELI